MMLSVTDQYVSDAVRTESGNMAAIAERLDDAVTIRLLHAAMGMATEAGELVDMLKKHVFYGKGLDEVMARNIAKLRARYPAKFEEALAITRDLAAERIILEGGHAEGAAL